MKRGTRKPIEDWHIHAFLAALQATVHRHAEAGNTKPMRRALRMMVVYNVELADREDARYANPA